MTHQFETIAVGIHGFNRCYDHLPFPAFRGPLNSESYYRWYVRNGEGEPLYSWRAQLIGFNEISWRRKWDRSKLWSSPANRVLQEMSMCYSYEGSFIEPQSPQFSKDGFPEANVLAITGPGTAWGCDKEPPQRLSDVPGDTILVVESRASGIPWPAPGDFDIRTMPNTINAPDGRGISSRHASGFHVAFADGQVWVLSDEVPFETLKKFFTVAGARQYDREPLLGPYAVHRFLEVAR